MTRSELIAELKQCRTVDSDKNIRVKMVDYTNNPISPEKFVYQVFYTSYGCRRKSTYFGKSIGFQG